MYKQGDKVILVDSNGNPIVPELVAVVEEVYDNDRVRLILPDNGGCLEFTYDLKKITEDEYNEYFKNVKKREETLAVDLQLDIRKFASKHPRRRKDEILHMFNQDKHFVSILNAYEGRCQMYGEENINERFLYEYRDARSGLVRTRSFFHELDESIPVPNL